MICIGLDIASIIGWSVLEDGALKDYGTIQVNSNLDLPQRLHFVHLELTRLFERQKPEWCFIEDVLLGLSGVKILCYLSRLNGVAINSAYSYVQEKVKLYTPSYWKANSFNGLIGSAKKWQIQLAAIEHYKLPIVGNFDTVYNTISNFEKEINDEKEIIISLKKELENNKRSLISKRNPPTEDLKKTLQLRNATINHNIITAKKKEKTINTKFQKIMLQTCSDITAQTGLTPDICDSIGVALCGWKELSK